MVDFMSTIKSITIISEKCVNKGRFLISRKREDESATLANQLVEKEVAHEAITTHLLSWMRTRRKEVNTNKLGLEHKKQATFTQRSLE